MLLDATLWAADATRDAAIAEGARLLAAGELLGLPTETVYGLAARADDDAAVAKIFAAKGRPSSHPLIVHVPDRAGAEQFVAEGFLQQLPNHAARLMDAFWPGPLTVIVPRRPGVGAAAAGGQDSVGLRCPSHPVALSVLQAAAALGVAGVAAPSANPFGRISPTTAQHVEQEFGDRLTVLDGGACQVGIESTIVDCTRGQPVLLRPGMISIEKIAEVTGISVLLPEEVVARQEAPRASGTLESHYAPRARVRLMRAQAMQEALQSLAEGSDAAVGVVGAGTLTGGATEAAGVESIGHKPIAIWSRTLLQGSAPGVALHAMPTDPEQAAQVLFAQLREFDDAGAAEIWVESVPETAAWAGVADRLRRAAA